MLELIQTILAFLLAIAVLVAVHEWGHFIVARAVGIKVLSFSIGFGRRLYSHTSKRSGVEYRVGWLPLGGYVKMLDEREAPVAEEELHLAFNRASLWRRIAVVIAGPAMNFIFAFLAYWLIFMVGVPGYKPIVDEVPAYTRAYDAGIRGGDEVLSVDNNEIVTFTDLRTAVLNSVLNNDDAVLRIRRGQLERNIRLRLNDLSADPEQLFPAVGLRPYRPKGAPVIRKLSMEGAADKAGLKLGDVILGADDVRFDDVQAFITWIQDQPGSWVNLEIRRDDRTFDKSLQLNSEIVDGRMVGRLGASLGVDVRPELWQDLRATRRFGPLSAIPNAVSETWGLTSLTVRLLGRMLTGDVSWRNIGGPIQIAEYAGATAQIGIVSFLEFMALVSVSLGVLNLLPIPILDGGHLLYYLIEGLRGRPVSIKAQMVGQQIGIFLLLALMSVAFYNDIYRLGQG